MEVNVIVHDVVVLLRETRGQLTDLCLHLAGRDRRRGLSKYILRPFLRVHKKLERALILNTTESV